MFWKFIIWCCQSFCWFCPVSVGPAVLSCALPAWRGCKSSELKAQGDALLAIWVGFLFRSWLCGESRTTSGDIQEAPVTEECTVRYHWHGIDSENQAHHTCIWEMLKLRSTSSWDLLVIMQFVKTASSSVQNSSSPSSVPQWARNKSQTRGGCRRAQQVWRRQGQRQQKDWP